VSIHSALSAGRRAAESLMLDYGRALRLTGEKVYDHDEQEYVDKETPLFTSAAKIQTRALATRVEEVGARTATTVRTELHLPADTPPLSVGDVWEVTAAHPMSLAVVGQRLRITAPVAGTLKTARRYEVEEVVS